MIEQLLPAGPLHRVRVRCSSRVDGDFHVDTPLVELSARRQTLAPGEWTWLHQVHGAGVIDVDRPGAGAGASADASVTRVAGAVLAVQSADCAPVALAGDGCVAVAHAGWRGLVAGVLPATVEAMRRQTDGPIRAILGPVIRPAGYEFGETDLAAVEAVAGPSVRSATTSGSPALDMGAAVRAVLDTLDVELLDLGFDTTTPEWFSHRTRGDVERQVTVAWLEPTEG